MPMPLSNSSVIPSTLLNSSSPVPHSYFAYASKSGLMNAHIGIMTAAWLFILPIGVSLSIARSRLALPIQIIFLTIHVLGLLLGAVYMNQVPDLYPRNSHHKLGWFITWVVVAQCLMEAVKLCMCVVKARTVIGMQEQEAHLQRSTMNMTKLETHRRGLPSAPYRYSSDSDHFTASPETSSNRPSSSTVNHTEEWYQTSRNYDGDHDDAENLLEKVPTTMEPLRERFARRIMSLTSARVMRILDLTHNVINRLIIPLGFIAFVSGLVVYGGVFRGSNVFNGLAHSIKGGIFFWYGLLTLGRWMGCFIELGWAWNVKPPVDVVGPRKARVPSAEFVESFVIFFYGSTNVFLEHLAAWGKAWSAQDLEHVSISIMFLGGGLCGMLIESDRIRDLLNSVLLTLPPRFPHAQAMREHMDSPKTYRHSLNPLPALIILLLGLLMSSHHQNSMVATMVHKQWGSLFIGFALARAMTYIMIYLSPPTSYLPSRPPSELITSFCLISGGIIFMASNKDTVYSMEQYGLHAMFPFTVTMGFTAFLMAWAIIVLAVKGWAVRNQPS